VPEPPEDRPHHDEALVVVVVGEIRPDHRAELRALLFDGPDPVVTSELTRVELASAVSSAGRARRMQSPRIVLDRFDLDCGEDGPFSLLRLDSAGLAVY
jgi:hypothetical protein